MVGEAEEVLMVLLVVVVLVTRVLDVNAISFGSSNVRRRLRTLRNK